VEAHHLDEISAWDQNSKIFPRMHAIGTQSSSMMFLLCSTQHLADDSDIRTALIEYHTRRTLRMVAIDEAHLHTMHGRTFRECIRVLRDVFFKTIFADGE